ncbi:MAG: oxygen-independent coproporphyrinogen III oxidase [Pseudomonadota bacterium]
MTDRLTRYATRAVPRYTSYPTAPHFSADLGADTYDRWLGELDPAQPLSLYLHVPFCHQLCWYCGCNMKLASRPEPVERYACTLAREIALVASRLPARMTLSHLAWGGGTPNSLSPGDFSRVMEAVRAHFNIEPRAELAIECDPRTLTNQMAATIGKEGFTRASFGVQEFDPEVQTAINRVQPPELVASALDKLRNAGVGAVNFDLIYGLPFQTAQKLVSTVKEAVRMEPDRFALFGYAHVPWMAKKQRLIDAAALPGASERMIQADEAARAIVAEGYERVGLDHFALPNDPLAVAARSGTLRRNFQGYTTDDAGALIGVGASSISRTPFGFVQNAVETGAWSRAIETGMLPVAKGRALEGQDGLRASVIEALMCGREADLGALGDAHGAPEKWWRDAEEELAVLAADGLLRRVGDRINVAEEGRHLVRVVAAVFDAYLPRQRANHSVAV